MTLLSALILAFVAIVFGAGGYIIYLIIKINNDVDDEFNTHP